MLVKLLIPNVHAQSVNPQKLDGFQLVQRCPCEVIAESDKFLHMLFVPFLHQHTRDECQGVARRACICFSVDDLDGPRLRRNICEPADVSFSHVESEGIVFVVQEVVVASRGRRELAGGRRKILLKFRHVVVCALAEVDGFACQCHARDRVRGIARRVNVQAAVAFLEQVRVLHGRRRDADDGAAGVLLHDEVDVRANGRPVLARDRAERPMPNQRNSRPRRFRRARGAELERVLEADGSPISAEALLGEGRRPFLVHGRPTRPAPTPSTLD
mmetsp:Transcript_8994/g.23092  ORF Transcript_8994/g.23092 Transcript_8994/m.23092 type:complete len:272 (-) Transcript_8994:245-1060(-)